MNRNLIFALLGTITLVSCNSKTSPTYEKWFKEDLKTEPLIVEPGVTKFINPTIHPPYSYIHIKKGGILICENGDQEWLMLRTKGDFILEGHLIVRNFSSGAKDVSTVSPDGEKLDFVVTEINIGGKGGVGGIAGNPNLGLGYGGSGTPEYGGGGGSGIGYRPGYYYLKPNSSTNEYGAIAPQNGGKGGDGAEREQFCNGGYVYILCEGNFNGENGYIDLTGKDGLTGKNGENGRDCCGREGGPGDGGGGGGGAPGGQGGVLIVKYKADQVSQPVVKVNGGIGGQGGVPGVRGGRIPSSSPAREGSRGQTGRRGFEKWIAY